MKKKADERRMGRGQGKLWSRRIAAAMLAASLVVGACTGCGAGTMDGAMEKTQATADSIGSAENSYYEAGGGIYEEAADISYDNQSGQAGILDERKLIQNVRLEVETKEFEQMMASLEEQVREMGGYIENMETYNGSSYSEYRNSRYADLTIRIPREHLDGFLRTVSDISNIIRRYDSVEDVTLSYVDLESHRNALRTEQDRLLEFLGRAETVEEIIALEERLSEVRYQLESMESQLRTMDNLIEYSTVSINISEVRKLTVVKEEEPTAWARISEGFLESLSDIGNGLAEAGIWFLVNIPYLLIWALVIGLGIWGWHRHRRTWLKKKEARRSEAENRMREQDKCLQEWENGGQNPEQRQEK